MNTNKLLPLKSSIVISLLSLSFAIVFLQLFATPFLHSLSFWNEGIHHWQIWRLLSAHFIHFNTMHCLINLVALWLITLLFFRNSHAALFISVLIGHIFLVDTGLYFLSDSTQEYIGLSGVLYGLFISGVLINNQYAGWKKMFLIAIIFCKIFYDHYFQEDPTRLLIHYDFIVAVDAHTYGTVSGLIIGGIFWIISKRKNSPAA